MKLEQLQVKLMATLWDNTYRLAITNQEGAYVASCRLIVVIPQDRDLLPPNAPEVDAEIYCLVEDGAIEADEIIDFENLLAPQLRDKFRYEIDKIYFFYPSPSDAAIEQ